MKQVTVVCAAIFLIPWRVGRFGPLAKGSEKCTYIVDCQYELPFNII